MSASAGPERAPEAPSLAEALAPVLSLVVLLGLAFVLFGEEAALGPNQIALTCASLIATFVAWRRATPSRRSAKLRSPR